MLLLGIKVPFMTCKPHKARVKTLVKLHKLDMHISVNENSKNEKDI